jgi:hypothetical protein
MQTPIFDAALRQLAVASISGYQKHISPRKGFSCAHRVLYGGGVLLAVYQGRDRQIGLVWGDKSVAPPVCGWQARESNLESPV